MSEIGIREGCGELEFLGILKQDRGIYLVLIAQREGGRDIFELERSLDGVQLLQQRHLADPVFLMQKYLQKVVGIAFLVAIHRFFMDILQRDVV